MKSLGVLSPQMKCPPPIRSYQSVSGAELITHFDYFASFMLCAKTINNKSGNFPAASLWLAKQNKTRKNIIKMFINNSAVS